MTDAFADEMPKFVRSTCGVKHIINPYGFTKALVARTQAALFALDPAFLVRAGVFVVVNIIAMRVSANNNNARTTSRVKLKMYTFMLTCTTHCRRVSNSILKANLIHSNKTVDEYGTLVLLKPLRMGLPPLVTHYSDCTVSDDDCNCVLVMSCFFFVRYRVTYTITHS